MDKGFEFITRLTADGSLLYLLFSEVSFQDALFFVFCAFVITEAAVWIPTLIFDAMAEPWKKYRIRQPTVYEQAVLDKVRTEQESKRIKGYFGPVNWSIYIMTWCCSTMSFNADVPSLWECAKENFTMIVILDFYIYCFHAWLHWRHPLGGKEVHDVHHASRYVGCWYVDHEAPLESLCIALGKYGILAYFSPHPYSAFVYLWIVKFWNVVHHCGHNLPIFDLIDTYLPFIDTPNLHEIHHFHHLSGNYAVFFTVFDFMFNTKCRSDLIALADFGQGAVKYEIEKDKLGNVKSDLRDKLMKRPSLIRRFRKRRESVRDLTHEQKKKLGITPCT